MDIYICCKNNIGMAKVHLALSERYDLEQHFNKAYFHKNRWLYKSGSLNIVIFCEEYGIIRGHRADLVYVQNTVSEEYIDTVLAPMVQPFSASNDMKFPFVPIQYFEIKEE